MILIVTSHSMYKLVNKDAENGTCVVLIASSVRLGYFITSYEVFVSLLLSPKSM